MSIDSNLLNLLIIQLLKNSNLSNEQNNNIINIPRSIQNNNDNNNNNNNNNNHLNTTISKALMNTDFKNTTTNNSNLDQVKFKEETKTNAFTQNLTAKLKNELDQLNQLTKQANDMITNGDKATNINNNDKHNNLRKENRITLNKNNDNNKEEEEKKRKNVEDEELSKIKQKLLNTKDEVNNQEMKEEFEEKLNYLIKKLDLLYTVLS